ncbi:MAG: hypothetical protein DSY82_04325 [Flavobacteriia bacterium]|nr:MAG: hypothetical protein DSY82_04325 [Flavobacteriia bacterium]
MLSKRFIPISFLFLLLISISSAAQNKNKKLINQTLDQWHKDVADSNFDNYFNAFTKDAVFIGTDANEIWNVEEFKSFSKPYFDKKNTWVFKPLKRNIYFSDDQKIAWFDEILDTWMGICRGSGVMKKEKNGQWKIAQYVLSVTVPNDNTKEIIEVKKTNDSIILKKLSNK